MFTSHRLSKLACTAVVAVGLGFATVATAATASASSSDDTFLSDISSAGIQYDSARSVIAEAHTVCSALDDGSDPTSAHDENSILNNMSDQQVQMFVAASAEAFCPEHLAYA